MMARKSNTPGGQQSQRATPRASTELNQAPEHSTTYESSPPRTPPRHVSQAAKGKATRKAPRSRPAIPQTFLDDQAASVHARGDMRGNEHDRDDSHDLSWSSRYMARDSVVDNMLLSLDQLPAPGILQRRNSNTTPSRHIPTLSEESSYIPDLPTRGLRSRGHTYSSSLSSDYRSAEGDSSPFQHHSRRSNSSSNFQSGLRETDDIDLPIRGKVYEAQRAAGPAEKGTHSATIGHRSRNGSDGNVPSSADIGQVMGGPRWKRTVSRRSSSTDQGIPGRDGQTLARSTGNLVTSRSGPISFDDIEAAPTPIIPNGPRRDRQVPPSVVFPPMSGEGPSLAIPLRRKAASDFAQPYENGNSRSDRMYPTGALDNSQEYISALSVLRDAPSISAGNSKPMSGSPFPNHRPLMGSIQDPAAQLNTKPGFFRRVFGSSSRNLTPVDDPSHRSNVPSGQLDSASTSVRADSRIGRVSPAPPAPGKLARSAADSDAAASGPIEPAMIPLNKKHSFFRRRKKSVSNSVPLPQQSLQVDAHAEETATFRAAEASPVSSLRKVMHPYLATPTPSYASAPFEHPDASDSDLALLAGNATRNDSRIRPKFTSSRSRENVGTAHPSSPLRQNFSVQASPNASAKSNLNIRSISDNSFLNDSSGSEPMSAERKLKSTQMTLPDVTSRPRISPTSPKFMQNMPFDENQRPDFKSARLEEQLDLTPRGSTVALKPPPTPRSAKSVASSSKSVSPGDQGRMLKPITPLRNVGVAPPRTSSSKSNRVWLEPTESEEDGPTEKEPTSPLEERLQTTRTLETETVTEASPTQEFSTPVGNQSPMSPVAPIPVDATVDEPVTQAEPAVETAPDPNEITDEDRVQTKSIYDGNENIVSKEKAAAWLGETSQDRTRLRRAYMELYDFQNLNVLASLRDLCGRLLMKGETQQVDRILDAFSVRWCQCNPNHGFKATDVVHTICYSILLLNTDLHMAEIEQKMTRNQFIRNTMPTIRRVASDAAPGGFETVRASVISPVRGQVPWLDQASPGAGDSTNQQEPQSMRSSIEAKRPTHRLSTRPSDHSGNSVSMQQQPTRLDYEAPSDACGPLVKAPFVGKMSTWEIQVEIVLKDFYNSIRQQRLPLFGSELESQQPLEAAPQSSSLSVATGFLRRTPSMLSKAGSENVIPRGRPFENRLGTGRWASKTRSRPRLYPASTVGSSRTSLDDQSSVMSPSASSTWSKYSFNRTQTSMSVDSFASSFPQGDYKQSIGFANALSQAIIREEAAGESNPEESIRLAPLLEDESLELAGAPWAKEGILKHKHHLESVDKKAKDRKWNESFAVIDKGWMRLFSFNTNAKSMRLKAKNQKAAGGVVGGGNWTENAEALDKFLLRQTIASALPPPGYSKARPFVFALSLPTGAVHLFQVGTPEIVREFVTTANYWSARLSKEPLVGGVSNIEYGWGEAVINTALLSVPENPGRGSLGGKVSRQHSRNPSFNAQAGPRPSLQSSIRSSIDQGSTKPKLPGDRITISDWTPPQQSMMASALMEVDQLRALTTYVQNIEDELSRHNELRGAMLLAFSPRHPNHTRAMTNWERKSSYLLREIVKFRTYIDCLAAAQTLKEKLNTEKREKDEIKPTWEIPGGNEKDKDKDGDGKEREEEKNEVDIVNEGGDADAVGAN